MVGYGYFLELPIFLLCFDYAIELLGNSSVLLWPGAATSPLAVDSVAF